MTPPDAFLVSRSAADDAAFLALADLASVLNSREESGIVGGHMVSLLCARFPSPGLVERRTGDADGGIPRAIAVTGEAHEGLIGLGYAPVEGNRYERADAEGTSRVVDLLVPNHDVRLGQQQLGGRTFDSMLGLGVAMANRLELNVSVTLRNDDEVLFAAYVPSLEGAIILKAYAWEGRLAQKDAVDLHSLFRIVESHPDDIGAWRLGESPPRGARRDAARILHALADRWEARPPTGAFDSRQLVSSVRRRVARQG